MKKAGQVAVAVMMIMMIVGCNGSPFGKVSTTPIDPDTKQRVDADVVIIGSELEGMYLARAASDEGLKVVVLDPREQIGGQLLQGEMLFLDEPSDKANKSLLQGKVKGLFEGFKKGDLRVKTDYENYFNTLIKGITVESGITITDVHKEKAAKSQEESVTSISYQTKDGTVKTISSSYWVENTDMNALSGKLGSTRIPGIETIFKGKPIDYMASSMMMKFKNVDWDAFRAGVNALSKEDREKKYGASTTVTPDHTWGFGGIVTQYKASNDRLFLRGFNTVRQRNGEVLINALLIYNVDPASKASVDEAIMMGHKETDRILPFLKQNLPGWSNAEVNGYPNYLYVREYNRFETDYVLQASDVLQGKMFWDNVSIAGYPIDLQGVQTYTWGSNFGYPDKYGMPLRSFMLKGYRNVLVAGKNVGASEVAYGSARIQANTSLAGETIGVLLSRIQGKKNIKEVNENDMKSLYKYMKSKYNIVLDGVTGMNVIPDATDEQIKAINEGKLNAKDLKKK